MKDMGSGTSRKRSGGFFSSALDDLKRKREEREAEEKKQAATTKTPETPESAIAISKTNFARPVRPTKARSTRKSDAKKPAVTTSRVIPQQQPDADETIVSTEQNEQDDDKSPDDLLSAANMPTPTPSEFPSCLNYTPPSHAPRPYIPNPSIVSALAPKTPAKPVVVPANPKLEDLYHIYLDDKGFEHKLMLLRKNPYLNNFARYDIRVYESHTVPHVYCTVVRYIPPAGHKPGAVPAPGAPNKGHPSTNTLTSPPESTGSAVPPPVLGHEGSRQEQSQHPEAARLCSLITPSTAPRPSPAQKYKTVIADPNSDFSTAWRAFRHAFRDLTLLSWHERLNAPLQTLRAQAFQIEPFVWARPAVGLPTGFMAPTMNGVPTLDARNDVVAEGYVRNAWNLPALDEPLGKEGSIGSAIFREAEEARRREEERMREEAAAAVRAKKESAKKAAAARQKYNKPIFNTNTGLARRPTAPTSVPQYYEPQAQPRPWVVQQQQQRQMPGSGGRMGALPDVPVSATPGKGKAIMVDYRTARQKRDGDRGSIYDY